MSFFEPRTETDLKRRYGYGHSNTVSYDLELYKWSPQAQQEWHRVFEVLTSIQVEIPQQPDPCECVGCCMTPEEIAFFDKGARGGFRYIAERHELSPIEMWKVVEDGLQKLGLHSDDLDDLQAYVFGWVDLTPEEMHRWACRYTKRCPLLDVLCSLDHTCEELNATQDWVLSTKGSYGRTKNDVLPALPDPDGIRPITPPSISKVNS